MSLLVLPIPFLPPVSSVSKPTIPISTLGVPIFDILKPLQPQINERFCTSVDASLEIDGGIEDGGDATLVLEIPD
ncbi:hypothetical protein CK203_022710 [Vitis vinifera]|uniref:Uncharacterized protein n=1 Tax=Vitis vinifera TaxID=29760 RepID=A0A438JEF5_VITVI|nr:hypothetical protein CK203_022710 [Vitis vinifera]